jgi:hypothetical protein
MPEKAGYRVFDTVLREYLATFKKPVKGCDVAVTRWTENPEGAMAFKVLAAAMSVTGWLNDGGSAAVVLNEKGVMV